MSDIVFWVFSVMLLLNFLAYCHTARLARKYRRECEQYNKQNQIELDAFAESVLEEINNKVGTKRTPWQ
jgi:hypothetical protein